MQKLTMSSRFCPFVPSFAFAVLLIPSLNVLSDYFLIVNLVAVPTVSILIKVVTQLL